jgi:acyl-coenzyme A synthetase/AMP-(fatty) acid ligase
MTSSPSTFPARLARHAHERGEHPAVVAPDRTLTYGELARATASLARELRARGVGGDATVAITARRETDHLLAALALLALGVPQLGLASHDPPAMRARFARRVGATHVLAEQPGDAVGGLSTIGLGDAIAASRERRDAAPLPDVDPHAPAIYLTGSGTTGEPKIVRYSQHELALQAVRGRAAFGERALRAAHVEHNNGKRNRLYTAWEGRTSVLAEGGAALRDICLRHAVTVIEVPPVRAAGLVVACRQDGAMPGVAMRIGGSIVPWALRRDVVEWVTPRLFVAYGATEVGNVSIAGPGTHDERELVGRLTDGSDVRIVGRDGSPVDDEAMGEIAIRTPGMATGYFDDPDATSRHFRDGWFMPGDMASMTRDGILRIHGRADDMMILNSINIFPAEIERVLEAHPAVGAAAAFPVASPSHGQIPAAAVELRRGAACEPGELVAYARAQLGVRAPRRIEILDALPRSSQGKILRRDIARRFETKGSD